MQVLPPLDFDKFIEGHNKIMNVSTNFRVSSAGNAIRKPSLVELLRMQGVDNIQKHIEEKLKMVARSEFRKGHLTNAEIEELLISPSFKNEISGESKRLERLVLSHTFNNTEALNTEIGHKAVSHVRAFLSEASTAAKTLLKAANKADRAPEVKPAENKVRKITTEDRIRGSLKRILIEKLGEEKALGYLRNINNRSEIDSIVADLVKIFDAQSIKDESIILKDAEKSAHRIADRILDRTNFKKKENHVRPKIDDTTLLKRKITAGTGNGIAKAAGHGLLVGSVVFALSEQSENLLDPNFGTKLRGLYNALIDSTITANIEAIPGLIGLLGAGLDKTGAHGAADALTRLRASVEIYTDPAVRAIENVRDDVDNNAIMSAIEALETSEKIKSQLGDNKREARLDMYQSLAKAAAFRTSPRAREYNNKKNNLLNFTAASLGSEIIKPGNKPRIEIEILQQILKDTGNFIKGNIEGRFISGVLDKPTLDALSRFLGRKISQVGAGTISEMRDPLLRQASNLETRAKTISTIHGITLPKAK